MAESYQEKFTRLEANSALHTLSGPDQEALKQLCFDNRFTHQELNRFIDTNTDLKLWGESSLLSHWQNWRKESSLQGREFKKWAFGNMDSMVTKLRSEPTQYTGDLGAGRKYPQKKFKIQSTNQDGTLFGMCPVQSRKTLCCNLRTIDAVKNCGFGCSYCSIQTMYTGENILFDEDFAAKLDAIELDPNREYHIGTGQSSDALMWGNKNGILDQMLDFARKWPNALIEFKTKSRNVDYFLGRNVPTNVLCSWSLNPDTVIRNEEHLTADLDQRLSAARKVADKGILVSFHLHPMVHYEGWQDEYLAMIERVQTEFTAAEIGFISFGSLTFPKPIIKKIRDTGFETKIHQIDMVPNPEGKMTYPDEVKVEMFSLAYKAFSNWKDDVFFYLCMEEPKFWDKAFGWRFPDNEDFEQNLLKSVWNKIAA
ncbi:MAG: spore photoproduct lyase [Parasphingorhabdus sp.]